MTDGTDERARAAFGPFDAMRTLSDLQAEGIRAASAIASRLAGFPDPDASSPWPGPSGRNGNGRAAAGDLRTAVGRLVDVYGDVLQRTVDAYAELLEERARTGPRLDGGAAGTTQVEIILSAAGDGAGSGELWLSNGTDEPTERLQLVASALVDVDGGVLSCRVDLEPTVVGPVEPGASTRVAVSILAGPGASPGHYHGYVLVRELPGEALPVTLVIRAATDGDGGP